MTYPELSANHIPASLPRRQFLELAALFPAVLPLLAAASEASARERNERSTSSQNGRLFFTSQGKTGLIEAKKGAKTRWLALEKPDQVTWQPSLFLSDGHRVVFLSMEARRDGPGKPFDQYYTQTPTHLWIHDVDKGTLEEVIANRERLAVFTTPALLLSDNRLLIQVVRGTVGQLYSVNMDGSDLREFTRAGEGLPYGISLSPDGKRVAFHLASPQGYQVWTSDLDGGSRTKIAAHPDHLYFGPSWSPDGKWLLYADCQNKQDPGHDWADVCVGRADGTENRVLTEGQAMWFAATYGNPENRGGGSNVPTWTRDGNILFPKRLPGSKVAWEFQANRPDTDHFNRDYKPQEARGGVGICRLDPTTGKTEAVTEAAPGRWDFRATESPLGNQIAYCCAATGGVPALWVQNHMGNPPPALLSRGFEDKGADHPRWLPQTR